MDLLRLWILGIIVNVFLTYSIIQIHFRSPILPISRTHVGSGSAEIKRAIVFVVDGLRADTFFANPQSRPRLENIIVSELSASGISVSEAPTGLRPEFIRMFAGLYQDPSVEPLLMGVNPDSNPGDFDILFNRTDFNVFLGCISEPLKRFAQGPGQQKIYVEVNPNPNYRQSDMKSQADLWVIEKFDAILNSRVLPYVGKILVVLHLCGAKHSKEELASITVIDKIVAHVESRMIDYFGDNRAMYVFTADHGMTNDDADDVYGKHGGGSRAEVETPIVVWGNGLKNTGDILRVEQVDIAAFLSGALNVPFPVHSVGRFPSQIWQNKSFVCGALQANLGQLLELMNSKRNVVNVGMLPFSWFPGEEEIDRLVKISNAAVQMLDYEKAIDCLNKSLELALNGINYYETYEKSGWAFILTLYSFAIWISLIMFVILNFDRKGKLELISAWVLLLIDIPVSFFCIHWLFGWSMWRIPYVLIPLYLTQLLHGALKKSQYKVGTASSVDRKRFFGLLASSAVGILILVVALYQREILTLGVFLIGVWSMKGKTMNIWKSSLWIGSLGTLAIFPNLPVVGISRNPVFVTLGPIACGMLALWSLAQHSGQTAEPRRSEKGVAFLQIVLVFSVYFLIHFPDFILTRFVSWTSLLLAFTAPLFVSADFLSLRITSIFLAISTPLLFLSYTYDSLFYPNLFLVLFILTKMEVMDETDTWVNFWCLAPHRGYGSADLGVIDGFRRAWLLIFFSYLSFFGTGNVYTFADMKYDKLAQDFLDYPLDYNKHVMFAVYKLIGPLLLVACFFRLLVASRLEWFRILLITLFLSQIMAICTFFFFDFDFWKDFEPIRIGVSIAHCVIPQVMTLGLAILYRISCIVTGLPPHICISRNSHLVLNAIL